MKNGPWAGRKKPEALREEKPMTRHILRSLFATLAVAAVFAVMIADADARSRGSFGSAPTAPYFATRSSPRTLRFTSRSPRESAPESIQRNTASC